MEIETETDKEQINEFVQRGNYHAALNIALSSLNECRRQSDQNGIDTFLGIIDGISMALAKEFGSEKYLRQDAGSSTLCAICGVVEEQAGLLCGINGAVCRSCALKACEYFSDKGS